MNTPPEGSLTPLPKKPVAISASLLRAVDAAPRSVPIIVIWPVETAQLMPVLVMHVVAPLPLFGAN